MSNTLIQQYGLFFIAVGLSLVLFLLVFLVLRRRSLAKRGLRPAAAAMAEELAHQEMQSATSDPQAGIDQSMIAMSDAAAAQMPAMTPEGEVLQADQSGDSEKDSQDAQGNSSGGFQLFRRSKKSKTSKKADTSETAVPSSTSYSAPKAESYDDSPVPRLLEIEQEMLALRELYQQQEITLTVYVAETKALYNTARLLKAE